jgi:hypothetical protein
MLVKKFYTACRTNDAKRAFELLKKIEQCTLTPPLKTQCARALYHACYHTMPDVSLGLIRLGYISNAPIHNSPLILACNKRMSGVALALIQANRQTAHANAYGYTALMFACSNSMNTVISALLQTHCNPCQVDNHGKTALYYACVSGTDPDAIRKLMVLTDVTANNAGQFTYIDNRGLSVLISLCIRGTPEDIILEVLKRNCLPNHVSNKGETALQWASYNGLYRVVTKLVEMGCDCHLPDSDGISSFGYICKAYKHEYKRSFINILFAMSGWADPPKNVVDRVTATHAHRSWTVSLAEFSRSVRSRINSKVKLRTAFRRWSVLLRLRQFPQDLSRLISCYVL